MRILYLSQRYAPARGGAEHHLQAIASRLAAKGHQITVVTTDALHFELFWRPGLPRIELMEEIIDGVQVRRFPVRHLPGMPRSYDALRRLLWILSRLSLPTLIAHRLARLTPRLPDLWHWLASTNEPFDLVVGVNVCYETLLDAGNQFARRRNIPFVCCPFTHLGTGLRPASDPMSQFYTMRHQVEQAVRGGTELPPLYHRYKRIWFTLGVPAFGALVIVFYLMVFKPTAL